ncbi:MAG: hypothetical protein OXU75_02300 [Deltaproteobacteria bacterium]|nr:hypothetical protein [Deltaproteobacteria bacterium]
MKRAAGILAAMLALVACDDPSDCTSNAAMGYAIVFAEDAVKRRIPNPHVADFDLSTWKHAGDGLWQITGHADTKNVFGGPVRAYYSVSIQCRSLGDRRSWTLEGITVR